MTPQSHPSSNVQLAWDLSRSAIETEGALRLIVMISLKAAADADMQRAPLNLAVVLDRSGSMQGAKLAQCKFAARFLLKHLAAQDLMGVVAFGSSVSVVAPHGPLTSAQNVSAMIDGLTAATGTNLSGGWLEGARMIESTRQDGRVNRVLLLTDGEANEGIVQAERLHGIAQDLRARNVQTTCIGFGRDFNEDLLKGIADAGGGNFHFIDQEEEARSIFARELQELLKVAAQNLRLRIVPAAEVRTVRLLQDLPCQPVDGGLEISVGDLMAGEEKKLLIELHVPRDMMGRRGITELRLTHQQVLGDVAFRELYALVETPERGAAETTLNPVVWREVVLSDAAHALRQAREEADKGSLHAAKDILRKAQDDLASSPHAAESDYVERRHELERIARMLDTSDTYRGHGRKAMLYASHGHGHQSAHARGGMLPPAVRKALAVAQRLVVVTGPGLAFEAGLPLHGTFEGVDVQDLQRMPESAQDATRQWRWIALRQEDVLKCGPTPGHLTIQRLQQAGRYASMEIVTSAVDGLQQIAGVQQVHEVYGSVWYGRCPHDGALLPVSRAHATDRCQPWPPSEVRASWRDDVPICACGQPLRPSEVWPHEEVPQAQWDGARAALAQAEGIIVAGTEANTRPMAALLKAAVGNGVPLVWIHPRAGSLPSWAPLQVDLGPSDGLRAVVDEVMWY